MDTGSVLAEAAVPPPLRHTRLLVEGLGVANTYACIMDTGSALVEVEAKIDNSLVVKESATHDPVAGHEACEVRTNMSDSTSVIEIGEVGPTADSRSLESKIRTVS